MDLKEEYEDITLDDLLEGDEFDTFDVWSQLQDEVIANWVETEELFQVDH